MKGDNINKRISEKHKKINNYDQEIENIEESKKLQISNNDFKVEFLET